MLANGKRRAARCSEGEWRRRLEGFDGSGLSVAAFCERTGIGLANFYRWRKRCEDGGLGAKPMVRHKTSAFVDAGPLEVGPSRRARLDLKRDLGDGWVVQLVRS